MFLETDLEFLTACYERLLRRAPDSEGLGFYLGELASGQSRLDVVVGLTTSEEYLGALKESLGARETSDASVSTPRRLPDVNSHGEEFPLHVPEQLALLAQLSRYEADSPFPEARDGTTRYHLDNPWFNYFDGIVLHALLRHLRPRRVVEVGSGFSSVLMLDTSERFLDGVLDLVCIDPNPERLISLIGSGDRGRLSILPCRVQDVDDSVFTSLVAGDVLFIDSSHRADSGSDVTDILFRVLPALPAGVLVHFHDIFWPFDYPPQWRERGWNEAYLLRALLSGNSSYEILLFNDFVAKNHRPALAAALPRALRQPTGSEFENSGVSLWLRKSLSSHESD